MGTESNTGIENKLSITATSKASSSDTNPKSLKVDQNLGLALFKSEKLANNQNPGQDALQFLQLITQIGKDWNNLDQTSRENYENQAKSKFQPNNESFELPEFQDDIALPSFSFGKPPPPPHLASISHNEEPSSLSGSVWGKSNKSSFSSNWGAQFAKKKPGQMEDRFKNRSKFGNWGTKSGWGTSGRQSLGTKARAKKLSESSFSDDEFDLDGDDYDNDDRIDSYSSHHFKKNTRRIDLDQMEDDIASQVESLVDDFLDGEVDDDQREELIDSVSSIFHKQAKRIINQYRKGKRRTIPNDCVAHNNGATINIIYPGFTPIPMQMPTYMPGPFSMPGDRKSVV